MTTTQTENGEDDTPTRSKAFVGAFRLAFPTAGLILAALYINSTYGRIRPSNLYYPYFVISMLALFSLTVFVDDIRALKARDEESDLDFTESVRRAAYEWRRSIGFTAIAIVYIAAIPYIGFFVSTLFAMVGIMLVGGLRDPKLISVSTVLVLVLIYVMFVRIMGLQPPEGVFGI